MTVNSIGDLALSLQLRRQNANLKNDLNQYSQELSSGISSDIGSKLRGNYSVLAGIERGISVANSYRVGISEKRLETSAAQNALEKLSTLAQISGTLLTVQETGDPTLVRNAGEDALARFTSTIQTLNTQVGGQTIFAGVATDGPALADTETIMLALEAEITAAGATTADDIATVVDDWFDIGGDYELVGYIGGDAATTETKLSESESAPPKATAQDASIRTFLSALAKGALVGRGLLALDPVEQGSLARISGEALVSANSDIVDERASIGITEAQIERANVEVVAEMQALELAKSELISVEPFDTAVRFENAQTQLETLYSVTAKLSGLSLANYL